MKHRVTIRDRLADEAERYLTVVDVFATLGADPHAAARSRAACARTSELNTRSASTSRRRRRLRR
jgi:hypothetical protein